MIFVRALSIFVKTLVAAVCFSVTYEIVGGWIGVLLGLLLSCLTLILIGMLTNGYDNGEICRVPGLMNRFLRLKPLLLCLVCVLSLASFYFISPMQSQLYVPPENILLPNWLRHICAMLLTTFIPGYMILSMVDQNQTIGRLNRVLVSYILSVLSTFFIGYIIILSGNSINNLGTFGISIFNVAILMIYFILSSKHYIYNRKSQEVNNAKRLHVLDISTLYIVAFWLVMVGLVIVLAYLHCGSQLNIDQQNYHGLAISLGSIQLPKDALAFPHSIWLFGTYLAMLFSASGIPSVNAHNSLGFLNIMPILAFFVLVKSFFRNHAHAEAIAALCTFLGFFTSGFGWMYTLKETLTGNPKLFSETIYLSWTKTYDILTPNSFVAAGHPDPTTPLLLIGLPAMFALFQLSMTTQNATGDKLKYFLIILTTLFGYLGHTETILMVITLATITLTRKDCLKILLSLLTAFLIVFAIDVSSPSRFYNTQGINLAGHFISFPILILLALVGLMCIHLTLQMMKHTKFPAGIKSMTARVVGYISTRYVVLFFSSLIIYLYLLAFVVWGIVQADFNTWLVFGYDGSVPWYFYPIRLGLVALIALSGLLYWISHRTGYIKQLFPFYVWAFATIGFSSYYLEYRLIKHLYLALSVIAGLAIYSFASRISASSIIVALKHADERTTQSICNISSVSINGKHLVATVLLAIVITSIGSNLLCIRAVKDSDYAGITSVLLHISFTEEEFEALNWLRLNIDPMTDTILYLPDGRNLASEIENIGGAWATLSRQYAPFFEVSGPDNFFDLCHKMRANYLYLTWKDRNILESKKEYANSFVRQLLNYLPVVFNNSKVTIYKFPAFAPPSKLSSTAFVLPSTTLPITTFALADLNYSIICTDNPAWRNYDALILPIYHDAEELKKYAEWVENGGRLIILDFPPNPNLERSYGAQNGTFHDLTPLFGEWSAIGDEIIASTSGTILSKETIAGTYVVSTSAKAVQVLNSDNHLGLIFNYQDSGNYYYAFLRSEQLVLYKEYNNTGREYYYANVKRSNETFQKLTVEVEPPVFKFYVDDVFVGEHSDQQFIGSGRLGLRTYNIAGQFLEINVQLSPTDYVCVNGITGTNSSVDIPEIEVPFINETLLSGETASLNAYYARNGEKILPFAFTIGAGKGTITNINFPPIFRFLENSSNQEEKRLLFSKLGEIFGVIDLNLPHQQSVRVINNVVEPICYIRSTINSTGEVTLNTNSFWFIEQKPLYGTIDLSNVTEFEIIEGNGEALTKRHLFNATILDYQINSLIKTTIETSYIKIIPSDSGAYAMLEIPDEFRLTTHLENGAIANVNMSIDGSIMKVSVLEGSMTINVLNVVRNQQTPNYEKTLRICTKYPEIQLTGCTFMESAYLSTSSTSVIAYGYPIVISGTTSFQIENTDQGITRISNLIVNGELTPQKTAKMWDEWNIPWTKVFTSNYHFISVIFTIVILIFGARKKKVHRN